MSNLYSILGFDAAARDRVTAADVKKAYRQEALKWHPDKHPEETRAQAEAHFKDLAHAFEILSDDTKRRLYDQGGMAAVERGSVPPPAPTPEAEYDAMRYRSARTHGHSQPRERATHRAAASFTFRDPFEIFDAVFRDMNRMMGDMHDSRRGMPAPGGWGFGGGSAFDDPFFRSPFGSDPFFAAPFAGRGGSLFGPSLMSAFDTGSMFAGPTPLQRQPEPQPQLQSQTRAAAVGMGAPRTAYASTTQTFSFSGSSGMGGQPRQGRSVTVETRLENGQRVTRTVQRTYLPDGTVQEEVSGPPVATAAAMLRVAPVTAAAAAPASQLYRAAPATSAQLQRPGSQPPPPPQQRPPVMMAPAFHLSQTQRPPVYVGAYPPPRVSSSTANVRSVRSATSGPGIGRVGHMAGPHFAAPSVPVVVGGRY